MTEYLWWREVSLEIQIQMLLYISSYYLKNESITLEIINFVLNCNDGYWLYKDKMDIVQKYVTKNNVKDILTVLEEKLIVNLGQYNKENRVQLDNISWLSNTMDRCLFSCKQELKKLSKWIVYNKDNVNLFTSAIIKLASCLSNDAKKIVLENYELKTVWQLVEKSKVYTEINIEEYLFLIDDYLKKAIAENNIPGVKKITIPSQEEYVRKIAFFIIKMNLNILQQI